MKKCWNTIKTGILFLTFSFSFVSVKSQCTITAIGFPVEQNSSFSQQNNGSNTDGQTFSACTGSVTSISIKMDDGNTYTGTMNLWIGAEPGSGNKLDGGPVYQTFEVTAANKTGVVIINLNTPFPVVTSNDYRMEFAPDGGGTSRLDVNSSNLAPNIDSYMDGAGTSNGFYSNIGDINFSITITAVDTVPTLGQWELIILGFCLIIVGVVGIRERVKVLK